MSIPPTKILRKLECIRLITRSVPLDSILDQLAEAGVFKRQYIEENIRGKRQNEKEDAFLIALEKAEREEKITLLHYELQVLPDFKAKLSILTPAGLKEFEFIE
jgi:hypothetical protein